MSKNTRAIVYALVAVLSWSTVATAFKICLQYLTHFQMVLVASATAMLIFALVLTLQAKWTHIRRLTSRQWIHFALLGLLNPVAYYMVLFRSYALLPAHVAQPINYAWPIVLLVMLALFAGQKIPLGKYLGMFLSLGGVALISLGSSHQDTHLPVLGLALGFLSAFLWAAYWMVNNRNKNQTDGTVALFMSFLFGTLYLGLAALFTGTRITSLPGILAGMYVGGFEMGIPFLFFAMALRDTANPSLVNQLTYLSPFLSLFLIATILHETIAATTVIGLVLIVLGIVFNEFLVGHLPARLSGKAGGKLSACLLLCLLLSSCIPQKVLNYALKRDAVQDKRRYESALHGYQRSHAEWCAGLRDTTMLSPNDGLPLHALYRRADKPTTHTVFLMHGYTGNAATMLNMALFYSQELGCNVFLPDFHAHGLSQGRMRQMGWLDRHDMVAWMRMANQLFSLDGRETQMLVTGVSMGGATTMMVSGEVESQGLSFVKCFVEDCGYTNVYDQFHDVVKGRFTAFLNWANHRCRRKYGWDFREASSVNQLANCHLPMLFIHGGADTYVPTRMVHEVYDAKREGIKELWIPQRVEHAQSFGKQNKEYRQRVKAFAEEYIKE